MSENKDKAAENQQVELGTEDRPYPMIQKVIGSDGRFKETLGVLSDGALKINSELSEDEILGMAFRDMPSPGMLKLFLEGSVQRESDDPRKVEFMMGEPGAGKSFLSNLHAKMRTKRGAILADCGDRDLSELLYETVLDIEAGKSLYQEIDGKLAKGEMTGTSINLLKTALGDAMSIDGSSTSIDWEAIKGDDAVKAVKALQDVAKLEGLGKGGDASIGLTTKEGAIIQAWKENRPVILDEYNKMKPGTDASLQILWQVFNGEMKEHTVKGGGGKSFTFRKDEMPDKFFVTLTGNMAKDGYSTHDLSASAYQRLQPQYIGSPTPADLQHRICQKLTGMPVSTIYHANESYWKKNPDEFTDYLIDLRKKGMSEEQQANIPTWQFAMLKNWENVLVASEQLAVFYDQWTQVTDPNSKLHKDAEAGNNPAVADLADEIDEAYAARTGVGLRRLIRHLDKATIIAPEVKLGGDIGPRGERVDNGDVPKEKQFGTRLTNVILEDVNNASEDKELLLDWLLVRAAEAGLIEKVLEEGRSTGDRMISNMLNIDPDKKREVPENIEEIHTMLCDYLRTKYEGLSEENADIISPAKLEHTLSQLEGKKEVERMTSRSGVLMLPNEDAESLTNEPIAPAVGLESLPSENISKQALNDDTKRRFEDIQKEEQGLEEAMSVPTEELVNTERFLVSLAIPSVKKNNIEATFSENNFSMLLSEEDVAYSLLNNTAENGLATNLLATKSVDKDGKESDEYLYVVHDRFANRGQGRTLVTGTTEVSPRLKEALEKNGVTYVNRNDANAKEAINEALDTITEGKRIPPACEMCLDHLLTSSLTYRNNYISKDGAQKPLYELPHQDLLYNDNPEALTDEIRGKHRENLTSLLANEGKYLEKSTGTKVPFLLTNAPDIDHLKHTLRHLTQGPDQQAAGMSK